MSKLEDSRAFASSRRTSARKKVKPTKAALAKASGHIVEIDYINYRGERRVRKIRPIAKSMIFGSNEWHAMPQWLFDAVDVDTGLTKTFAMSGIHSWKSAK